MPFRLTRARFLPLIVTLASAVAAGCGAAPPTAPSANEGGAGGGDARKAGTFAPFVGALPLGASTWDRIVEGNVAKLRNDGSGALVAAIPVNDKAKPSLNYIFSPGNRDLANA